MNATTATYDEPVVWAPLLVEWADGKAADYTGCANDLRRDGCQKNAADHDAVAATYRAISLRAAERLTVATKTAGLVAAGVLLPDDDEPPIPLVDLTAWLRGKLGRWFPWVLPTDWQAIACVLLRGRP